MGGGSALVDYTSVFSPPGGHYYYYDLTPRGSRAGRQEGYGSRRHASSRGTEGGGRGDGREERRNLYNHLPHEQLRVTIVSTCEKADDKDESGEQKAFDLPSQAVAQLKELVRSQIRTLLHFPLFRHIVNVNCATAFSYPFLSSPSPPPPPLASSPSSTNPSTHHTAYASAGPHGSSLPKDASSSSSLPALSQGSGQSAFAEQHQQRQVWRDRREEEEEGDLVCNEASSSSSGSSGSGDRKRNSSSTSPLVLRPDELPDKTAGGRGREGEVGQRDGGEEEEGCGSGERMGEDFVFPKTNRAERQEASIGLSDQGKDRTPFNQRTSETEDKEITRKNDLSQDRSVGVSPAEREGRCLYSRERKSRDVHIRSLSGQYPYSSSHPADSAAYQEGERDVPLLAISTGEGGEVFERKNGEQRTQRRERGGEGERRQEEGFRVENDDSHSRPGNVIVVPPSASSSSSFFLPSYPHSHLFTPGVFSSWDGQKRQTSSLFSRWRRSTDPENAEQAFSHGSRSDSKEGSSLTGKDKDEGRGRASRSSGHPGDGQNVADSSAHGSACSLLLPLSLSSPPSKLQVLRCMLADTAAATIQRVIRGHLGRLRVQDRLAEFREYQRVKRACVKIQASWRRFKAMEHCYMLRCCELLERERWTAATRIQAYWKMRVQRDKYRIQHLTECLAGLRRLAAIEVQRIWRGSVTRKVLDDEWKKWIIKWPWDKPGTIVEVIGDFSNPPWTKRHLMTYCHVRRCFILPLARKPGRYEIKFIVDGRYVCDGSQTVVADGNGHFNNLIRVRPATKSPFREIRERLQQLQEQSTGGLIYRSVSSPSYSSSGLGGSFINPHSLEGWTEFVTGGLPFNAQPSSGHHRHHHHHHRRTARGSADGQHDSRGHVSRRELYDESWAAGAGGGGSPSSPPPSGSLQCFSDVSGQDSLTSSSHSDDVSSQWNTSWDEWYRGGGGGGGGVGKRQEDEEVVGSRLDETSGSGAGLDMSSDMSQHQGDVYTADPWATTERRTNATSSIHRQSSDSSQGRQKRECAGFMDSRAPDSRREEIHNNKEEEIVPHGGEEDLFLEDASHHHHHTQRDVGCLHPQGEGLADKLSGDVAGGAGVYAGDGKDRDSQGESSASGQGNVDETDQDNMCEENKSELSAVSTRRERNFETDMRGGAASALQGSSSRAAHQAEQEQKNRVTTDETGDLLAEAQGTKVNSVNSVPALCTSSARRKSGESLTSPGGASHVRGGSALTGPLASVRRMPLIHAPSVPGVSSSSRDQETSGDSVTSPSRSPSSPERLTHGREEASEGSRSEVFSLGQRRDHSSSASPEDPVVVDSRSNGENEDDVISSSSSSSMSPRAAGGKGEDISSGGSWGTNTTGSASTRTSFLDRGGGGLHSPSVMPDHVSTVVSSAPVSPRSVAMPADKTGSGGCDAGQAPSSLGKSEERLAVLREDLAAMEVAGPDDAAGEGPAASGAGALSRTASPSGQEKSSSVLRDGGRSGKGRKGRGRGTRANRQSRLEPLSSSDRDIESPEGGQKPSSMAGVAAAQVSHVQDKASGSERLRGCIIQSGLTDVEQSSLAQPPGLSGSSSAEVRQATGSGDGSLASSKAGTTGGKGGGAGGRAGKKKSKHQHRRGKAV